MKKKALIFGITGQDGACLADLLLKKNYEVYGTSRDVSMATFAHLKKLNIFDKLSVMSVALTDLGSVLEAVKTTEPDEIYNLAGQSSVGLSFEEPIETLESNVIGTLNVLEAIRFLDRKIKLYNACSSECFGDTGQVAADEKTVFRPRSPYGVAKAAAFWEVSNYRDAYDLFTCSGLLFNHESPFRPERFVTRKIIRAACEIAEGEMRQLRLGNLEIVRDWGWAPEYVEAMWLMLQRDVPEDFVIATGTSHSLHDFVRYAFEAVNLNYEDYVVSDPALFRPLDIAVSHASPKKAEKKLDWKAHYSLKDIIQTMIEIEKRDHENL